jgi:hypothetical protein
LFGTLPKMKIFGTKKLLYLVIELKRMKIFNSRGDKRNWESLQKKKLSKMIATTILGG